MAASFILAHDTGTYSCKTLLLDPAAGVVARSRQHFAPSITQHGRAEQSPDDWWAAFVAATRATLRQAGDVQAGIRAIVFTGQMLGLVPVSHHAALGNAILWPDARAHDQAVALTRAFGGKSACRVLFGAAPGAKDVVPKIVWMRQHDAGRLRSTHCLLDVPGYCAWRATGVAAIDWSGASATGLLDRRSRRWNGAVARYAGVPLELLPPIATPGAHIGGLLPAVAAELGLRPGTPVLCGTGDVVAAALGCGAGEPGLAHLYFGTSGWICSVSKHPGRGVPAILGQRPQRHYLLLQSESVGACFDWLAGILCGAVDDRAFQQLEALVQQAASGAGGTVFRPFLWGERAPFDNPGERAAFRGIGAATGRAELARAVWEGVVLNIRRLVEQMGAAATLPRRVRVCGGAARSDVFVHLLAESLGLELERVHHPGDSVALGAALLAAEGLGLAVAPQVIAVERSWCGRRG